MVEGPLGGGLRLAPLQPHLTDEHDQPPRAREPVVRLEGLELGEELLDSPATIVGSTASGSIV